MFLITSQYIFDMIPISAILLFHHLNYRINTAKLSISQDEVRSEKNCILDLNSETVIGSSEDSLMPVMDASLP